MSRLRDFDCTALLYDLSSKPERKKMENLFGIDDSICKLLQNYIASILHENKTGSNRLFTIEKSLKPYVYILCI